MILSASNEVPLHGGMALSLGANVVLHSLSLLRLQHPSEGSSMRSVTMMEVDIALLLDS